MYSLDVENNEIVHNEPVNIYKHMVDDFYEIIPRSYALDSVGCISKHSPVQVTDENSLMVFDNHENRIINQKITEVMKDPYRYFMIVGAPNRDMNDKVTVGSTNGKEYTIELNHIVGFMLAIVLKKKINQPLIVNSFIVDYLYSNKHIWEKWIDLSFDHYKKTYNSSLISIEINKIYEGTPFDEFQKTVIMPYENEYVHMPNELIFSSNVDFVVGMLEAFVSTEKIMTNELSELVVYTDVSVSIFTNILTYLFADFSVVKTHVKKYPHDYSFAIHYQLSPSIEKHLKLIKNKAKIKRWTWQVGQYGHIEVDAWERTGNLYNGDIELLRQLSQMKHEDKIKFIRFDEVIVKHVRTEDPVPFYDLVMGYGNANNYLLFSGPFAKNSDGDILAIMGIMSKEGIESAKQQMITNVEQVRNALDPDSMYNWIQKDATAGLYVGTKGG